MISPEKHSHSELAAWRRCEREHHYSYVLRRMKRAPDAKTLTKGKSAHGYLGSYHLGVDRKLPEQPDIRALVRAYEAYWTDPKSGRDRMFQCERTDVFFSVPLGDVTIVGEFDGVGIRLDTGKKCIIEHKTTSEDISLGSSYWRKVSLTDPQVSFYLEASKFRGWGHTEVLYDVLRKPAQKPRKNETEQDFENRILSDIAEEPERYFQRATVVRLEHEAEEHKEDVRKTVYLMRAMRALGGLPPRNVDSCFKWGRPCQFWAVCAEGASIDDDFLFMRKEDSRAREQESWDFE